MPNNNELTEKEKLWASNLKKIWDEKRRDLGLTQEKAAEMYGCTQGNISQYLLGRIPLNIVAINKFATILQCDPSLINPEIDEYFPRIKTAKDLIPFVQQLSRVERSKLVGIAEMLADYEVEKPLKGKD